MFSAKQDCIFGIYLVLALALVLPTPVLALKQQVLAMVLVLLVTRLESSIRGTHDVKHVFISIKTHPHKVSPVSQSLAAAIP